VRRAATALALLGLIAVLAAPAEAKKRHHKPSGIEGVVLDVSCYGPCIEPRPAASVYPGPVTVTVRRASDGVMVGSREVTDGKFRFKLKRGLYDVSSVPPGPPSCPPGYVCPAEGSAPSVVIMPCLAGETKRVQVRKWRFTHVELHVTNVCIV
jgi:hypothetical protein